VAGGAAAKGGIEPGDVILEFNGRGVKKVDDLVKTVTATKPGTSVPVKLVRNQQERTLNVTVDELDLEAEQTSTQNRRNNNGNDAPAEQNGAGFGLTLQDLTPAIARRLQVPAGQGGAVVTDVEPDSGSAMGVRPGDIILSINRRPVSSAADAARELQKVRSGGLAQLLLWRDQGQVFVPVKKD